MTTRAEQILQEHLPAIIEAGEDGAFLRNVLADRMQEADEDLHAEFWRLAAKMCWTPREEKRDHPFPFDWFSTDGGPSPNMPEKCRVPPWLFARIPYCLAWYQTAELAYLDLQAAYLYGDPPPMTTETRPPGHFGEEGPVNQTNLPPLRTAADAPDLIRAFLLAHQTASNETVIARLQEVYDVTVNNRQVSAVRRGLRGLRPKVDPAEELEERYTVEEFRLAKRFLSRLATVERAHALLDAVAESDEEE